MSWCSVCLEWDPCTLSAAHGWALLWHTLCTTGSAHACMPGAVFTACGRGAVQQPHPPHICIQASSASSHTSLLFVLVFRERTAGPRAPCALRFCSTRVCSRELKWWECCCFFSLRLIICVWQRMGSLTFQVLPRAT